MADHKVTRMVMKVDLQCSKCYRKIKKVLCSYPQIRDQEYNVKQNTVRITVACCSPEKIKEKIACKAGDTVESIEIIRDERNQELDNSRKPIIPSIPPPPPPPPPPVPLYLVGVCCCCYPCGPCYHGRGPMCYVSCRDGYFSDENAWGCSVM